MQLPAVEHLGAVAGGGEDRVEAEFAGQAFGLGSAVEARFGTGVDADGHSTAEGGRPEAPAEAIGRLEQRDFVVGGER